MNTTKLRSKRVLIPTLAAIAVLGVGGVAWSSTASADLQGSERDRVGNAAVQAAGGGTAVDVESSDDRFDDDRDHNNLTDTPDADDRVLVDVRDADNADWDVELDADFKVLSKTVDR